MNYIWTLIIVVCIIFSFINGSSEELFSSILDVPEKSLNTLLSIGSVLIIYGGIFKILEKSGIINKISFLFSGIVEKIFNYKKGSELNDLICISLISNMIGLGQLNTNVSLKIVSIMKESNDKTNIGRFLLINISSFTILPLSLLSIRENYFASFNLLFIPILIITSFITTVFSIIIGRLLIHE